MKIVENDSWLEVVSDKVDERYNRFETKLKYIKGKYGSLKAFASVYEFFGFSYDDFRKGWWYREWAPAAHNLFLFGDFNGWNRYANPLERENDGIWSIFLPDSQYKNRLVKGSLPKLLCNLVLESKKESRYISIECFKMKKIRILPPNSGRKK